MRGFFYPPPPTFIGGRQPYAAKDGIAQSGPTPDNPPPRSLVVLGIVLAGWVQASFALPPQAKIAPLIPAAAADSAPIPYSRINFDIIARQWNQTPETVIYLNAGAPQLTIVSAPPVVDRKNFDLIGQQWISKPYALPRAGVLAPLLPAAVQPDNPPPSSYATLNLIVRLNVPPPYALPKAGTLAPNIPIPPRVPYLDRVTPVIISMLQRPFYMGTGYGRIAHLSPQPPVISAPPGLTYVNRDLVISQWRIVERFNYSVRPASPTSGPASFTAASIRCQATRRGWFGNHVVEADQIITITNPYEFTPYWMTLLDAPPSDWTPLFEIFNAEIDRGILRPSTEEEVAALLRQDPGPYKS